MSEFLNGNELRITTLKFNVVVAHATGDADAGKAFTIANFPSYCTIKMIKLRADWNSHQQTPASALVNDGTGVAPGDTSIDYDNLAGAFAANDYVKIKDELILVGADNGVTISNLTRHAKGTLAGYIDDNEQIVLANNGIRMHLYEDSNKLESERILTLSDLRTWQGVTDAAITATDEYLTLTADILNVDNNDYIFIDDTVDEEAKVQSVNHDVLNATYDHSIFVKDPLAEHAITKDVYKQVRYDIPTPYNSDANTLYGTIFIDEKIAATVTVTIDIIVDRYES